MAERVGFEPTLPFRVNTLSKRAPSATRPSLRRKPGKERAPRKVSHRAESGSIRTNSASLHSMGEGNTSANRPHPRRDGATARLHCRNLETNRGGRKKPGLRQDKFRKPSGAGCCWVPLNS